MREWNSEQYLKFKSERTQPSIDLVNRLKAFSPERILDIGCGPGNSTEVLRKSFPNAYISGIDSSEDMIAKAKRAYPEIDFVLCDAARNLNLLPKNFDIIFSNACMQWLPDHRKFIADSMALLNHGGVLAVQIPINYEEPIHKIINRITHNNKWNEKLPVKRKLYNLSQEEYFDILSGFSDNFEIWQTTYFHRMKSHNDIIEWYKGTGMRPYLELFKIKYQF